MTKARICEVEGLPLCGSEAEDRGLRVKRCPGQMDWRGFVVMKQQRSSGRSWAMGKVC